MQKKKYSFVTAVKYRKTDTNARAPSRAHPSDSGSDLVLVNRVSVSDGGSRLEVYDTGIQVCPPPGHYFEMYARSSLYDKCKRIIANGTGIIDEHYRGNIKVKLLYVGGVDDNIPEVPLNTVPLVQLILKKRIDFEWEEQKEPFEVTDRNDGGFGSSDAGGVTTKKREISEEF